MKIRPNNFVTFAQGEVAQIQYSEKCRASPFKIRRDCEKTNQFQLSCMVLCVFVIYIHLQQLFKSNVSHPSRQNELRAISELRYPVGISFQLVELGRSGKFKFIYCSRFEQSYKETVAAIWDGLEAVRMGARKPQQPWFWHPAFKCNEAKLYEWPEVLKGLDNRKQRSPILFLHRILR